MLGAVANSGAWISYATLVSVKLARILMKCCCAKESGTSASGTGFASIEFVDLGTTGAKG